MAWLLKAVCLPALAAMVAFAPGAEANVSAIALNVGDAPAFVARRRYQNTAATITFTTGANVPVTSGTITLKTVGSNADFRFLTAAPATVALNCGGSISGTSFTHAASGFTDTITITMGANFCPSGSSRSIVLTGNLAANPDTGASVLTFKLSTSAEAVEQTEAVINGAYTENTATAVSMALSKTGLSAKGLTTITFSLPGLLKLKQGDKLVITPTNFVIDTAENVACFSSSGLLLTTTTRADATVTVAIGEDVAAAGSDTARSFSVKCAGINNRATTLAAHPAALGFVRLKNSADAEFVVSALAGSNSVAAVVSTTIPDGGKATISPSIATASQTGITVTFTFDVPAGTAALAAADVFTFVGAADLFTATGTPSCTSPQLGFNTCSTITATTIACPLVASSGTFEYGAGRKVVTCTGVTLGTASTGSATAGTLSIARGGNVLTTSAANVAIDAVYPVATGTLAYTDPTVDFSVTITSFDRGVALAAGGTDTLWVTLPRGTTGTPVCTIGGTGVTESIETSDRLKIVIGVAVNNQLVSCSGLKNTWREGGLKFQQRFWVTTDVATAIRSASVASDFTHAAATLVDGSSGQAFCFAGGLSVLSTGNSLGDAPAVNDRGKKPACFVQGATYSSARIVRLPTMHFNHAGHSFIEWNGSICAAGGGLFEGLTAASFSVVSKNIECWDKNPHHGWVQVKTPGLATFNAGNNPKITAQGLLDGSAAVSWRGMICLTGGLVDAVTSVRTVVTGLGDAVHSNNLKTDHFSDGVLCTADGLTWKHSSEAGPPVVAMSGKRAYHSAAVFSGKMCVSGGYRLNAGAASQQWNSATDIDYLRDVSCTTTGQVWQSFGALAAPRVAHSMVVFRGELCVVGGSHKYYYNPADAFALECTRDGDGWLAYDGPVARIQGSGAGVDPRGALYVPVLTADNFAGLDHVDTYTYAAGWRTFTGKPGNLGNFDKLRAPAMFSFKLGPLNDESLTQGVTGDWA